MRSQPVPDPRFATVPARLEDELRGTRLLGLWSGLVGIALVLSLTVPVIATIVMGVWGDDLAGPPDGDMFHGAGVFFGWLLTSLAGLALISVLAMTALTLDILMLVRLDRLRTLRAQRVAPLGWSLLAGTGVISTPVLGVLLFAPVWVFGPGTATRASLVVLFVLMGLLPIAGRVAEMVTSRGVRLPVGPGPHPPAP